MLIVCPSCLSAYRLPEAARENVTAMRCAECGAVFEPSAAVPMTSIGRPEPQLSLPTIPADLLPVMRPVRPMQVPPPARSGVGRSAVVLSFLAVGMGLGMAGVAWRAYVAHLVPATAPFFAAVGLPATSPGLSLGTVETALADEGSTKVLTLEGTITNARATEADVPNLRIVVRDDAEQAVYSWVTASPRPRLGPGEAVSFRSRLVSPPANGHDLVVSFADAADGTAPAESKTAR